MNSIVQGDVENVITDLGDLVNMFNGKRVLITGYKGFLGANFIALFNILNKKVLEQNAEVYCLDNDIVDLDNRVSALVHDFKVYKGSSIKDLPVNEFHYIIHCAGIASPTYYRKYPLETINVNAIGYWEMLNHIDHDSLEGFLYFSTSEIYGDPDTSHIPTDENYRGNVSCTGPRACYDESKRVGETISVSFAQKKKLPIKIVRPFNVYGPFMRLNDRRVIPDFVKFALEEGEIKLFSDGSPTRAFCYISDAIAGFTRVLLTGEVARPYNIGNDSKETSMWELAQIVSGILGGVKIERTVSEEENYLTDNPQRRCPVIERASSELNYNPVISPEEGIERVINWYKEVYFKK